MKTIRAYGGMVLLYRSHTGWEWESRGQARWSPPRAVKFGNKQLYLSIGSALAGGWSRQMSDARRHAVNHLKKAHAYGLAN